MDSTTGALPTQCLKCYTGWELGGWKDAYNKDWVRFCTTLSTDDDVKQKFIKTTELLFALHGQTPTVRDFTPKSIATKSISGYSILHNYSVSEGADWENIVGKGLTPRLVDTVEDSLKDIRNGHVVSGVFSRSRQKEFLEIQTFTHVYTEVADHHLDVDNNVRAEQAVALASKIGSHNQGKLPVCMRGNVPVPTIEMLRQKAIAARTAMNLPLDLPPLKSFSCIGVDDPRAAASSSSAGAGASASGAQTGALSILDGERCQEGMRRDGDGGGERMRLNQCH